MPCRRGARAIASLPVLVQPHECLDVAIHDLTCPRSIRRGVDAPMPGTGRDRVVAHADPAQDEGGRLVDQFVERALGRARSCAPAVRPRPASPGRAGRTRTGCAAARLRGPEWRLISPAASAASSDASNSGRTRSDTASNSSRAYSPSSRKLCATSRSRESSSPRSLSAAPRKWRTMNAHHADERRGRGRQAGERFERGVAFAAELPDLAIEQLLAREMLEQQRLGDAGGLGQLARRRAREPLAREKRHRRRTIALRRSSLSNRITAIASASKRLLTVGSRPGETPSQQKSIGK